MARQMRSEPKLKLHESVSSVVDKLGRRLSALSCVRAPALPSEDQATKRQSIRERSEETDGNDGHEDEIMTLTEEQELQLQRAFDQQRLRRSSSFTGLHFHQVEYLRRQGVHFAVHSALIRKPRCHSYGGTRSAKMVEIGGGCRDTQVIDGLLTTTLCYTEL